MAPAPATPTQAATALLRRSPGRDVVMIDSVEGMTSAAPRPMRLRQAMSMSGDVVIAAQAAPTANTARPQTRTGLRP